MSVLRLLPTDGTYDQLAPLKRLTGKQDLFSFDLKSATDTLPAVLSACVLKALFGDELAELWLEIMQCTAFRVHSRDSIKRKRAFLYRFTKGQPLGFSSSWPVLTLTHHAIVWLAAWNARPNQKFLDYAILGDDLVISGEDVAKEYLRIMDECTVTISKEKSLISSSGACEFAKKFMTEGCTQDFSPVTFKVLFMLGSFVPAFYYHNLGVDYQTSVRLRGGGYRAYSGTSGGDGELPPSRFWFRHWLLYRYEELSRLLRYDISSPSAFKLWLTLGGRGPLDPYRFGVVYARFLSSLRPGDFDQKEIDYLRACYKGDEWLLETMLVQWLTTHLLYVDWYYNEAILFTFSFEELAKKSPMCLSWRRSKFERSHSSKLRYGIMFKLWDLYGECEPPLAILPGEGFILRMRFGESSFYVTDRWVTLLDNILLD